MKLIHVGLYIVYTMLSSSNLFAEGELKWFTGAVTHAFVSKNGLHGARIQSMESAVLVYHCDPLHTPFISYEILAIAVKQNSWANVGYRTNDKGLNCIQTIGLRPRPR